MKWTPDQEAAIRTRAHHVCVDAGAGSGKTRVLIDRIIGLIENDNVPLDEIVAITFTEKAAAEMKDRLRDAFRRKAPLDDPQGMSKWRDMERRVDTARISTFHSFCSALLRENALRCGLDPDFAVLTEAEAALLREQVTTDTLHRLLEQRHAQAVHAAVKLGVPNTIGMLSDLLRMRGVAREVADRVQPRESRALVERWRGLHEEERLRRLDALVHSEKVSEYRRRLEAAAGLCTKSTDKRELARIEMIVLLGRLQSNPGPDRVEQILTGLLQIGMTRSQSKDWSSSEGLEALKQVQEEVRKLAKKNMTPPFDEPLELASAELTCAMLDVFDLVDEAFAKAKHERAGLDFDDLIAQTRAALTDCADIRARLARGIRYLLVDEFQDTDSDQLAIARALSDHPGGPHLFIVGDAKQSIYDFRGAEVEVFQREKTQTKELIALHANFRSSPDVLGFVNHFFAKSGLLAAVEELYQPMTASRLPLGGNRVEFLIPEAERKIRAEDGRMSEAAMIAARIDAMCRGPERVTVLDKESGTLRPADFGDVALLFRSTTNQHLYERALRLRGIPFQVLGGAHFYERQEVADIHSLLRVLVNPWDEPALLAFLRGPIAALSDESLIRLARQDGLTAAFHRKATPLVGEQAERLEAARALVADLSRHMEWPLGRFIRYVLDRTEYEAIALSQFLGVQRALNVRKLSDLAEGFSRTRPARLSQFVRYLDEVSVQEGVREGDATLLAEGRGPVLLMTIHKSKGLEFPITVLPDTSASVRNQSSSALSIHKALGAVASADEDRNGEGRKDAAPILHRLIRDAKEGARNAESARLLYVAMTRARDWLLIGGHCLLSSKDEIRPQKGSWLEAFDSHFGVCVRQDGCTFGGTETEPQAWSAVVRRKAPATERGVSGTEDAVPALEAVTERLARVTEPMADTRPLHTISVSKLLDRLFPSDESEGDRDPEAPEPPRHRSPEKDPLLRGTLVHKLLELWDEEDADPVRTLLGNHWPGLLSCEPIVEYLRATAARFRASALGRRLATDADAQRETPFTLRVGDWLVNGVVDLALADGTIVDYKTGRHNPELHARYECQLLLYAAALRKQVGCEADTALLYYVDAGEEHRVDVSPGRVEEAMLAVGRALESGS